jgi:SAM-dependent methyltransferase
MGNEINFMSDQKIGLHGWFQTPAGSYLLAWERIQLDLAVANVFGFHALQLGLNELNGLAANRMPHRWLAMPYSTSDADFVTDFTSLPFSENSLDLVLLPHALELAADPHTTLREVERVLVPEGKVIITGLNPMSLWGLRQRCIHSYHQFESHHPSMPKSEELIGYWRLRDWLRLLDFEVETVHFGCYRPPFSSEKWLARFKWMERVGERGWPIFGGIYFLVAVKRVRGMTLMSPSWRASKGKINASASVASSVSLIGSETQVTNNK